MLETALVTGATGFVGAAVARALLANGHRVRVLVRASSDRRNLVDLDVEPVTGDLDDPGSLPRALAGCTALFHVAADYRLWVTDAAAMNRTNVDGTTAILRAAAAAGVGRAVYTSSVATLGHRADDEPADEATPSALGDMVGTYKRSKFLAEEAAWRVMAETGLPLVVVNPSTPIGPRDVKPTPTGRIVVEAASGRIPAFVDTGLNLVHVDDVAAGHLAAFAHGRVGERYILGGENYALARMLGEIAMLVGRPPPRIRLPRRPLWPLALACEGMARLTGKEPMLTRDALRMAAKTMFFTSRKATSELAYEPRPAREALADAIAWFRSAGYLRGGA